MRLGMSSLRGYGPVSQGIEAKVAYTFYQDTNGKHWVFNF